MLNGAARDAAVQPGDPGAAGPSGCATRVLLTEDEASHAEIVLRAFGDSAENFEVTVAPSIARAGAALAERAFDLVISDWFLPDGEGPDLLRLAPDVPVLLMTSQGNEEMAASAIKAGALDYVVKSYDSLANMPYIATRVVLQWRGICAQKEAERKIRLALREKELLLKEVHHRVKNNLQVICSLLGMQIARGREAAIVSPLQDALNRAAAMALVHEHLYQSESLAGVDFAGYIRTLAARLFEAYCVNPGKIRFSASVEPIALTMDDAAPCGLILNELLSNSLKHAFVGRDEGEIVVYLRRNTAGEVELEVRDDGIGLPPHFDLAAPSSLGLEVVGILAGQLDASLSVECTPATRFILSWQSAAAPAPELPIR